MPKRSAILEITSSYPVVIGEGESAQTITCRAFVERISARDGEWPKFDEREFDLSLKIADIYRAINALTASLGQPKEPGEAVSVQFAKAVQRHIDAMMAAKDDRVALDDALLAASTELGDFRAKLMPTDDEREAAYQEVIEQVKAKRAEKSDLERQMLEARADRVVYLLSPYNGWDVMEDDENTMTPITRENVMTFSERAITDMLEGAIKKALGRPESSSTG